MCMKISWFANVKNVANETAKLRKSLSYQAIYMMYFNLGKEMLPFQG